MKREYFAMLFIIIFVALIFIAEYFFGEKVVMANLSRFIVIWVLLGFYVVQYSMKYPKAFRHFIAFFKQFSHFLLRVTN